MTAEDASASDSLIQGECFVNNKTLTIFYDPSASHSFISIECARVLGLGPSILEYDLSVYTPPAQNAITSLVCRCVPFIIRERSFTHDLSCLPLLGIDIILVLD